MLTLDNSKYFSLCCSGVLFLAYIPSTVPNAVQQPKGKQATPKPNEVKISAKNPFDFSDEVFSLNSK